MGIPLHQARAAMLEQGCNGAITLPIPRQSADKGMLQGMPGDALSGSLELRYARGHTVS